MARGNFSSPTECLDRRRFLTAVVLTAAACTGVGARITEAKAAEIIRVVPRQRPDNDIEGWNLGLMSAQRPELTPAENRLRMGELRADISNPFGRFQVRRRYIPMLGAEPIDERAFLWCPYRPPNSLRTGSR